MARFIYAPDHPEANENGFIPAEVYYPWKYGHAASGAPSIIRDHMDPLRHMADGKTYDSKSTFRKVTKAHGCIEIGNEKQHVLKPRQPVELDRAKRRDDIRRAKWELENGRRAK
jgi:hypothetical protein